MRNIQVTHSHILEAESTHHLNAARNIYCVDIQATHTLLFWQSECTDASLEKTFLYSTTLPVFQPTMVALHFF